MLRWHVSFFPEEPVPVQRAEPQEREVLPAWIAAPVGEVPIALPVTGLLASSQHVAVVLRSVRVHSNGVEFEIQGKLRKAGASEEQWEDLQGRFSEYGRVGRRNTGRLRVGVLLADGSRALSAPKVEEPEGEGPKLTRGGGGGTGSDTFQDTDWSFWLWPLPPDGPLALIVDWTAMGLPEQRFEFDGAFAEAARRAISIWPDLEARPAGVQPSWTISF